MDTLVGLFVQNPAVILLVAIVFFGAYLLARRSSGIPRPKALLWPAAAWAAWAVWEFVIVAFSPEADIRVDLLVIVPVLLLVSVVGIVMSFVKRKAPQSDAA